MPQGDMKDARFQIGDKVHQVLKIPGDSYQLNENITQEELDDPFIKSPEMIITEIFPGNGKHSHIFLRRAKDLRIDDLSECFEQDYFELALPKVKVIRKLN